MLLPYEPAIVILGINAREIQNAVHPETLHMNIYSSFSFNGHKV